MATVVVALVVALGAYLAASAPAKMTTTKISNKVCKTTGGGKFVRIKQFPGEKIDRRLRRDIRYLIRKFDIYITDGYSLDPVHSANGEHPIGLALDIVPNFSTGGNWNKIDRLASWAEPSQNVPRAPFRWVGYNGDAHHGRGHHLHLSYSHSVTSYNKPARTVYSIKCPRGKRQEEPVSPPDDGGDTGGTGGTGGISSYSRDMDGSIAPPQPERAGVDG